MTAAPPAPQPDRDCPLCPRLAALREANRAAQPGWHNAPVPSWGPAAAPLLVLGMAPGQKGPTAPAAPSPATMPGSCSMPRCCATAWPRASTSNGRTTGCG
ncbi:hypothetical protein [Paeniroseomonas aquatica]